MAMFLMSMTNFADYYGAFERTEHEYEAKLLFVIYMGIVAILLINMLIAMMGNTYQKIAETRNEWQRQVKILSFTQNAYMSGLFLFYVVGSNCFGCGKRRESSGAFETINGLLATNV